MCDFFVLFNFFLIPRDGKHRCLFESKFVFRQMLVKEEKEEGNAGAHPDPPPPLSLCCFEKKSPGEKLVGKGWGRE